MRIERLTVTSTAKWKMFSVIAALATGVAGLSCGTMPVPIAQVVVPYDLATAPSNACWSLAVGSYRDHLEQKESAADAVRELRKAGIEAYVHHGKKSSIISIGAWPGTAVKAQGNQRLEIVDQTLAETIRQFPWYVVNGSAYQKDPKTGKKTPVSSFLVRIPRSGEIDADEIGL